MDIVWSIFDIYLQNTYLRKSWLFTFSHQANSMWKRLCSTMFITLNEVIGVTFLELWFGRIKHTSEYLCFVTLKIQGYDLRKQQTHMQLVPFMSKIERDAWNVGESNHFYLSGKRQLTKPSQDSYSITWVGENCYFKAFSWKGQAKQQQQQKHQSLLDFKYFYSN